MLSLHAREYFRDVRNLFAMMIFLTMGLIGESKETVLALVIFLFVGLVVKLGHWQCLFIAMALTIPKFNLFL